MNRWVSRPTLSQLASGALLLLAAALAWRTIVDLDFGIHMASGRWILENGGAPTTDPFTWTVPDNAYVAYHWLFQIATYLSHAALGDPGPTALRWLLLMATAAALAHVMVMRSTPAAAAVVCGLLVLLAAEPRFTMRPHLVSYFLIAATLWLLERHRAGKGVPWWSFALVQLVWINTHIYALGWILMLLYAAGDRWRTGAFDRQLWRAYGVALLVLPLNPYHFDAVAYPLLLATRMDADNPFAQYIGELASPFDTPGDPRYQPNLVPRWCYRALLGLGAAAVLGLLRARRFADAGVILVFGALSGLAVRNTVLFAVATLPAIASGLGLLAGSASRLRWLAPVGAWIRALVGVLALLTAFRVVTGAFYQENRRPVRFGTGVSRERLAISAADWLREHDLAGRGFNNLNVGGALAWRDPGRKIFIDGRNEVTGEAFLRTYLDLLQPAGFDAGSSDYEIEYVVLSHRGAAALARHLTWHPEWKAVFRDGVASIFARRAGPNGGLPEVELPATVTREDRWKTLESVRIAPGPRSRIARWLRPREPAPGETFYYGTFLMGMDRPANAEAPLLQALLESPNHAETHYNLGAFYYRTRRWRAAALCYERALALWPDDARAATRLALAREQARRKSLRDALDADVAPSPVRDAAPAGPRSR